MPNNKKKIKLYGTSQLLMKFERRKSKKTRIQDFLENVEMTSKEEFSL